MWEVRDDDSDFDPNLAYVGEPGSFSIAFHHGGEMVDFPEVAYVRGKVTFVDNVDVDLFSVIIINDMIMELGYEEDDLDRIRYHFRIPGDDLELGLRPLSTDSDILRMIRHVEDNKVIDVYVELLGGNIGVGDLSQADLSNLGEVTQTEEAKNIRDDEDVVDVDVGDDGSEQADSGENEDSEEQDDSDDPNFREADADDGEDESEEEVEGEEDQEHGEEQENEDDRIVDEDHQDGDVDVTMAESRGHSSFNLTADEKDRAINEKDIEDGQDEFDLDDFYSDSDHETTARDSAMKTVRKKHKKSTLEADCPFYVGQDFEDRQQIRELVKKYAISCRRQLHICRNDSVRFRVVCRGVIPTLNIQKGGTTGGETTGCGTQASGLPTSQVEDSSSKGKSVITEKSNEAAEGSSGTINITGGVGGISTRSRKVKESGAQEKDKENQILSCPWLLHISKPKREGTWRVKTFQKQHYCLKTRDVNLCNISWLVKEIEPILQVSPEIKLKSLVEMLQRKHQLKITTNQIFRARAKAMKKLHGDFSAQFQFLREYGEELMRSNPGTTVRVEVESACNPNSPVRQFKRIYICLGASSQVGGSNEQV